MTDKRGGLKTPVNELALIPKIAALLATGKATTAIAEELNIGFNTVKRIAKLDETKSMVKEIGDAALQVAKASIKKHIGGSIELANEVLTEHLKKERSLDAVKLVYKVAGVLNEEPEKPGQVSQGITVVMPGASVERPAIEVTSSETDFRLEPPDESLEGI